MTQHTVIGNSIAQQRDAKGVKVTIVTQDCHYDHIFTQARRLAINTKDHFVAFSPNKISTDYEQRVIYQTGKDSLDQWIANAFSNLGSFLGVLLIFIIFLSLGSFLQKLIFVLIFLSLEGLWQKFIFVLAYVSIYDKLFS